MTWEYKVEERFKAAGFEPNQSPDANLSIWRNEANIVVLGLNKAPVNSLDISLLEGIKAALEQIADAKPRALILTSQLGRVFSAGLDLKSLHNPNKASFCTSWGAFEETWQALYLFPHTTIAAVHGAAPAGGTVLTLSCDYRIATTETKMGLNETAIGMIPPDWLLALAERVLGTVNAERAVLSGRVWKAEPALALGYIDELVDKAALFDRALEQAMTLSAGDNPARGQTKRRLRQDVAALAGPESVETMWHRVSSKPFQAAVNAVLESLRKR